MPEPAIASPSQSPEIAPPRWLRLSYLFHLLAIPALAISNAILGVTVLAATRKVDWKAVEWRRLLPLYLPLSLYVVLLAGSIAASPEPRQSLRGATEVFSLATLFLGPLLLRDERVLRRAVDAVIAMGGLSALFGLAQLAFGFGDIDRRIRGPFSHWMTFAGVLLVCDFLVVARILVQARKSRLWHWAALAAINLGLIASLTRSAWLAAALTAGGALLAIRPRWLIGLLPAALLAMLLAPVPVLSRIGSVADPRDPSNYDRLCMLEAGLRMVREQPIFGIGPELVRQRYSLYRHPTAPRYEVPHLHGNLIELAAERGLPSALVYLWLIGAALWLGIRRYRSEGGRKGPAASLYLGSTLALIAFNLAGLFEFNWGDIEVQRLVLFVAWIPLLGRAAKSAPASLSDSTG